MENLGGDILKVVVEIVAIVGILIRGHVNVRRQIANIAKQQKKLQADIGLLCGHLGLSIESGPYVIETEDKST